MRLFPRLVVLFVLSTALVAVPSALGEHATDGADVKVTRDNNVDGGTPNPGFDAQNRQSNEATVDISPEDRSIVAAGANDYWRVTVTGDVWLGFYVSQDSGGTWFNTMVPGFPSDTSPSGLASPLLGLDASGDPLVRFDADAVALRTTRDPTSPSGPTGRSTWPIRPSNAARELRRSTS